MSAIDGLPCTDNGCNEATCSCRKCPNYDYCKTRAPDWYFKCQGGKCVQCSMDSIVCVLRTPGEPCAICFETRDKEMKFPACDHFFCVGCTRNLIQHDQQNYQINPALFGGPECPNGCENPPRMGRVCACEARWTLVDEWQEADPRNYKRWNDLEGHMMAHGDPLSSFGSRTCPLCRAVYP